MRYVVSRPGPMRAGRYRCRVPFRWRCQRGVCLGAESRFSSRQPQTTYFLARDVDLPSLALAFASMVRS